METPNPVVTRANHFDAVLRMLKGIPEASRLPVVRALEAYFDNKPYAEILFEDCDA